MQFRQQYVLKDPSLCSDTTVGIQWRIRIPFPGGAAEIKSFPEKRSIHSTQINKPFIGSSLIVTLLASRRLAPTSFMRKPALQTVGDGRSSIRSTIEINLPPSICTRRSDRFFHGRNLLVVVIETSLITRQTDGGGAVEERRTCVTLNGSGIQLAVGPQPLWLRNHNFGLAHRIMVKRLKTSPHDPLRINDSACKNQLVVVSVQYGPSYTYIPIRSTTIGKSRVAIDLIAMHTSWRSNSDITSVTSIGYPRMRASGESSTTKHRLLHASGPHPIPPPNEPKTFHSTNGNHFESPNEGNSIDHQVTIHLHAQNITMFPTNETWYFASQMLVSSSGGLILILTAQSTRNELRMPSDY
ncbi:hypothetical protein F511_19133 [Dorcoceras hygrometricum]|uniref:Uncharacterized protein n=1 Tax=Dorcoceras hygrometricum TaxID=472368 RepID=A0A2Z7A8S2_9LAMI|nr:hypothetical protein F511_19133 [Dorcoceras hygrometricum]